MLYMSSCFWLFGGESSDFSWAKKEKTASKAEQIHKMATIFTPNDNLGPFWVKTVVSLWICKAFASRSFFLSMRKITWLNSQQPKTKPHVGHPNLNIQIPNRHYKPLDYRRCAVWCVFQRLTQLNLIRNLTKSNVQMQYFLI